MVYNCAWPLCHECQLINWNWSQIKLNSSLSGVNDSGAGTLSMFPIELLVSKLTSKICSESWSNIRRKFHLPLTYISSLQLMLLPYPRSATYSCRYLDLDSAKLLATALVSSRLNYCNSLLYGIADTDLTNLQRLQNRLACIVTKAPRYTHSVPLLHSPHRLPVKFRILFKITLLTYKAIYEKQPAYFRSMLPASPASRSLRSNKGISLSVPRVKTNMVARAFHSCARSLRKNLQLSVRSAIQLLLSRNISRHISLSWPFPYRHQHTQWPADVKELLRWFCCWTPIRLSRHWAWLQWGY